MRGELIPALLVAILVSGCAGGETGGGNETGCVCTQQYDPVCGSDGKTYGNECLARCAGANVTGEGECADLCTDSDGGKVLSIKGTAEAGEVSYTDRCFNFTSVMEYFCDSDRVDERTIDCAPGQECDDGACGAKKDEPAAQTCTDTDGGKDLYAKGTAKSGGVSYTDSCLDTKTVNEQYCEGAVLMSSGERCPAGFKCEMGRCIESGDACADTDGGNDIYKEGKVTANINLVQVEYLDKCLPSGLLREYFCDSGEVMTRDVECPGSYYCVNAACKTDVCYDSDSGIDIYRVGAVNKGDDVYRDECLDSDSLMEYYCESNQAKSSEFKCPTGQVCSEGRCED